jgi:hypothetical protein
MTVTLKDASDFVKRFPLGVGCGLVAAVMLGGFYFRSDRADEASAQLKQFEEDGRKIDGAIGNAASLPEQYTALGADTRQLEARLLNGTEHAHNQRYFYQLEADTGVKEISLESNSSPPNSMKGDKHYYGGIAYSVTVEGDYRQILDFVGRLESGQYFYRLSSASVSRRGDRISSKISLTLNIELLGLP